MEWTNEECRLWSGENGKYKNMECGKKEQQRIGRISAVNSVDSIISTKKPLILPFFHFYLTPEISTFKRIQHQNRYLKGL